ncbi:hypothetical protein AB0I94_34490 [Streptomyces sp. NPDC050147]|uniref:hypothetical protein n=1 Tax=Streptomyces sp. NPDC050147 TaxID=3155513 RepID=UPI003436B604
MSSTIAWLIVPSCASQTKSMDSSRGVMALGQVLPVPLGYLAAEPASAYFGVRATLAAGAAAIVAAMIAPLLLRQVRALALAPVGVAEETLVSAPR